MVKYLKTNRIETYTKSSRIATKGFNSIIFHNAGECVVRINGLIEIAKNGVFCLNEANPEVEDVTAYYFTFEPDSANTTGELKNLIVITSFITDNPLCR